jgi:hypothetical protein
VTNPAQTSTAPTQTASRQGIHDGLVKTGLIGAGALTITWWALIACGVWRAMEWAGV